MDNGSAASTANVRTDETSPQHLATALGQMAARRNARVTPVILRMTTDVVDSALIGSSLVFVRQYCNEPPTVGQCATLAISAICLAVVGRKSVRQRWRGHFEPIAQHVVIGGLATLVATGLTTMWWIFILAALPHSGQDPAVITAATQRSTCWELAWTCLASCSSMSVNVLACLVARALKMS